MAALAADALGPENVTGVLMPSRFSSDHSKSDAVDLIERLGLPSKVIPIEPAHQAYLDMLADSFEGTQPGVAEENLQSRTRGNILMALSNKFGWLVLTTGNKSEMAVGYATIYGDMAGGLAVIKDVPKTMVYQLAEYINKIHRHEAIPIAAITRPPSAELRENQKDTDSLPQYDRLDQILKGYVEEDKSASRLIEEGLPKTIVEQVINMVDHSEYKRRQSPPGIKITPKAFGKDRRMPITNRYASEKFNGK